VVVPRDAVGGLECRGELRFDVLVAVWREVADEDIDPLVAELGDASQRVLDVVGARWDERDFVGRRFGLLEWLLGVGRLDDNVLFVGVVRRVGDRFRLVPVVIIFGRILVGFPARSARRRRPPG